MARPAPKLAADAAPAKSLDWSGSRAHGIFGRCLEAHGRLLQTATSSMSHFCEGAQTLEEQRCWAGKPGRKVHIKHPPGATSAPILQGSAEATFSTFALTPKTPPPPPRVSRRTEQENLRLLLRDYHFLCTLYIGEALFFGAASRPAIQYG